MKDTARRPTHPELPTKVSRSRSLLWMPLLAAIIIPVVFLATERLAAYFLKYETRTFTITWSELILIGLAAALAAMVAYLHILWHWKAPLWRTRALFKEIRLGQAPIEELSAIKGGIRPLIPLMQELFRDLKQQKGDLATLEHEMRQRMGNRADALERIIGTLKQQATHDILTGLYNRRMFDQFFPQLLQRCQADNRDMCLMMIDVDHFKILNDTLGHAAGDQLLIAIGQLIRSGIREQDAAFRWGGDEFAILLPGSGPKEGQALAQRLAGLVDNLGKTLHLPIPPGLSIGIAALSQMETGDPAKLLKKADQALYEVKFARKSSSTPLQSRSATVQCPALLNQRS